jgi:hypothetical protein
MMTYYRSASHGGYARNHPNSTRVEVWAGDEGWIEVPLYLDLVEDPDWRLVDVADIPVPTD